jgi:hypothetical protein
MRRSISQWHVEQEPLEQLEQPLPEALIRLPPPPMPKADGRLRTSGRPQAGQQTSASPPSRTSFSNVDPHDRH